MTDRFLHVHLSRDRASARPAFAPCAGVSERVCFRAKVVRRFRGTGSGPALRHGHRRNLADERERERKRKRLSTPCVSAREIASNCAIGFSTDDRPRDSDSIRVIFETKTIERVLRNPRVNCVNYELESNIQEFYNLTSI